MGQRKTTSAEERSRTEEGVPFQAPMGAVLGVKDIEQARPLLDGRPEGMALDVLGGKGLG